MRARNIKPGICDNEILGTADLVYTVLFERLWMMADREGRLEDRPARIKAKAFPYRDGLDCEPLLLWLHDHGFILRYSVDGRRYIQIVKFSDHQRPHSNEAKSVIPPPSAVEQSKANRTCDHGEPPLPPKQEALRSDSLIPDSLIPDSQNTRATAEAVWRHIRADYPSGIYRDADWLIAERHYHRLVDSGEVPDRLFEAVTLYRAQQLAKQAIGTQFVLSPSKFFGDRHWRGPFPLPLTKADVRLTGNMTAMQEFIEGTAQ